MNPVSFAGTWFVKDYDKLPRDLHERIWATQDDPGSDSIHYGDCLILRGGEVLDEKMRLVTHDAGMKEDEDFAYDERQLQEMTEAEATELVQRLGLPQEKIDSLGLMAHTQR